MPHFTIQYDISCQAHHINHRPIYSFIHQQLQEYGWSNSEYSDWELVNAPILQPIDEIRELRDSLVARYGQGIWRQLHVQKIIQNYDILNDDA